MKALIFGALLLLSLLVLLAGWPELLGLAAWKAVATSAKADAELAALRVQANFLLNMPAGLKTGAERKQPGTCGTVRYEGELREADRLVEKWR